MCRCPWRGTLCPSLPCYVSQETKLYTMSASLLAAVTNYRVFYMYVTHIFLTVLEAECSRSSCQHSLVLVRTFLRGCGWPISHCTLTWWKERENSLGHPCHSQELQPHDPITSHRYHLLPPSHWGLGFQHFNIWTLGGHKHLNHNRGFLLLPAYPWASSWLGQWVHGEHIRDGEESEASILPSLVFFLYGYCGGHCRPLLLINDPLSIATSRELWATLSCIFRCRGKNTSSLLLAPGYYTMFCWVPQILPPPL